MPDFSPESTKSLFTEKYKNDVLGNSYSEITQKLDSISPKIYGDYRKILVFGTVFETLAVQEQLANTPETLSQKGMRRLVEDLYQQSQLALGELTPISTPDFVSVIFDKNGELIVDQIVEMKTSGKALEVGIGKEQPKKSVETIERVVSLINSIIENKSVSHLSSKDKISNKKEEKRQVFLNKILKKIAELDINETITLSPSLEYVIILPQGENRDISDLKLHSKDGTAIEAKIINSQFSKKDIHHVIDHYAENDIE
ncbi:MAG: hypothetical protein UX01_C0005G0054 [Candidatus Collierbacteria bacterium GW2011_GWB2_45_17]|uniref:Uncharacterized protein n=1 Tax=Candidatus Collierbacteria bacterium GW2011_GWB2_45_17 TaxID=1618388 RepID=A0A837IEC1_9BACT|nr:MAG: hypothetical protein UW48_C0004G0054 [Microgenomates group bacterium GW2011_GWC1_44_23]KKT95730.1 MAG: hypothetical protein UW96_C0005G0054 [Candidatus Collierbacteria bacterium GW2011_GWA1_45_15]KKU00377.1 MAG: hypothetical protein UX01_C0005G0054 [Candidatus Collierbacteria bacterium GW2011_GWB2_45_17]KKU07446.1 MAG: hypothetical protein UX11_C0015G0001 [Candidatus Collierbacteria bacterium GW2011_GWC2_45_40]HBC44739.1 hypothetical protein [Candidatus Collierbacteria bacterium]